jgi:hypothetical protein
LLEFNSSQNSLISKDGKVTIKLFQKIMVQITVTDAGENQAQRSKLVLKLLSPKIQGMIPKGGSRPNKKKQRLNK